MRVFACLLLTLLWTICFPVSAKGPSMLVKMGMKLPDTINSDWILSLSIRDHNGHYISNCAAVLVKPGIALTAAHCLDRCQGNRCDFEVTQGKLLESATVVGTVVRNGTHPRFNSPPGDTYSYDVGFIVLNVKTTGGLAIIAKDNATPGAKAILLGWGKVGTANPIVPAQDKNVLRMGNVEVVSSQECNDKFAYAYANSSTLCTKPLTVSEACSGDSGGPLIAEKTLDSQSPALLGITKQESQDCESVSQGRSAYTQASALVEVLELALQKQAEFIKSLQNPGEAY
jgi:secreted trypsin-like serine protease